MLRAGRVGRVTCQGIATGLALAAGLAAGGLGGPNARAQTSPQPPPSQPAPSQPAPSQPAPSQPAPSQPAPSQPAPRQRASARPGPTAQQQRERVEGLIEQLGAAEYAARVRAHFELQRMGLIAFDALHRAQEHEDTEIAMRAKYLVRSMRTRIEWSTESDPAGVREILRGYGSRTPSERLNRMEQLAKLDDFAGVPALCRLARYEVSGPLSKRAALLIMDQKVADADEPRLKLAEQIDRSLVLGERPAARWLETFSATLRQPTDQLARWDSLTREELEVLARFPAETSRDLVRDLLRWHAELLRRLDRQEASLLVMERSIDLLDNDYQKLMEMVDWLMEREAWPVVIRVAERFPAEFSRRPLLLYRLAETHLKLGDQPKADEIADKALNIAPEDVNAHVVIANGLRDRGLTQWSITEFQHVMKASEAGSITDLYARFLLSEILHDIDRDDEAADALEGVVKAMEKKEVLELIEENFNRDPAGIRSRMNFFRAVHASRVGGEGDRARQRELLRAAIEDDPTDADVLIAMYRLPGGDEAWQADTRKRIAAAADIFRGQVRELERRVGEAPATPRTASLHAELAQAHNQLAWLISNTEGDFDEALRSSQRSLELRPNRSGYLDTLGRCYYAKGDYENAVKFQAEAVQLEPSSAQIRRQLELFQQALKQRKQAEGQNPPADTPPNSGTGNGGP